MAARQVNPTALSDSAFNSQEIPINEDPRRHGSDTCAIDAESRCWCGQQWDGEKMCRPAPSRLAETASPQKKADA